MKVPVGGFLCYQYTNEDVILVDSLSRNYLGDGGG